MPEAVVPRNTKGTALSNLTNKGNQVLTLNDDPKPTHQGLDVQRSCTQSATQQERDVIDQTDLETDVEPVLGWKSSQTSLGKTRLWDKVPGYSVRKGEDLVRLEIPHI